MTDSERIAELEKQIAALTVELNALKAYRKAYEPERKTPSVTTIDDCAIFIDGVLRLYGDDVIPEKRH